MTDMIIEIMIEVLTIFAIATKEVKRGRLKKYFKKLMGNRDVEESLESLDKLTQEEARMAYAEQLKMTHRMHVSICEMFWKAFISQYKSYYRDKC